MLSAHDLCFVLYCLSRICVTKAARPRHMSDSFSLGITKGVLTMKGLLMERSGMTLKGAVPRDLGLTIFVQSGSEQNPKYW